VTVRPLFNADLFEKFIRANSWTSQFLPNSRNGAQIFRLATPAVFLVVRPLVACEAEGNLEKAISSFEPGGPGKPLSMPTKSLDCVRK
jgi:hypothetical protein